MSRPTRLVVVVGTTTDVGKTWVSCRLLALLTARGLSVSARKPAQSFSPADLTDGVPTDADLLARASGERVDEVCPSHRWYPRALAPPMAAEALGRPPIHVADLVAGMAWSPDVAFGLVETAGGTRSPIAHDGDGASLAHRLAPDAVILVADAALGAIHAVRSSADALAPLRTVVILNRFDAADDLHQANLEWLRDRDGFCVVTDVTGLATRL